MHTISTTEVSQSILREGTSLGTHNCAHSLTALSVQCYKEWQNCSGKVRKSDIPPDEDEYGVFTQRRKTLRIPFNHGLISEDEAEIRLRQRGAGGDDLTQTFMERRTFLLWEEDNST